VRDLVAESSEKYPADDVVRLAGDHDRTDHAQGSGEE
jgi:hypothetical protein